MMHLYKIFTRLCVAGLIAIVFSFFSCSRKTRNERDNKKNEFFTRLLFLEGVAYTIHGSKPISEVVLDRRTAEEKEVERKQYLFSLSEEMKQIMEKQQGIDWEPEYDFETSWDEWENGLNHVKIRDLMIVHVDRGISNLDFVYFVNIIESAKIIQLNYSLFREYMGFDFNPLDVVLDFEKKTSKFWEKMFAKPTNPNQACLWGILFGYGVENSYPYSWIYCKKDSAKMTEFVDGMLIRVLNSEMPFDCKKISSQDFPIPGFISFSSVDPNVERYKQEREIIKQLYLSDNFESVLNQALFHKN